MSLKEYTNETNIEKPKYSFFGNLVFIRKFNALLHLRGFLTSDTEVYLDAVDR